MGEPVSVAPSLARPTIPNQGIAKSAFRADIQGLRAFAVVVVILDHMLGWPSGGFIGVDIFFVISGFLITGHLIREWEAKGKIDFVAFYKGRVRRILPAAALTLIVTVGAAFLLFNSTRAWSVFWDALWASLFSANWRFASIGTDYFEADGPVSPLQHFWSLAVEEQFYFVWPFIMLLALIIVAKSGAKAKPRLVAGSVILAVSLVSLGWALMQSSSSPTAAYFSTITRTWELGLGAILALATPMLIAIKDGARPVLAWLGVVGMVASLFLISEGSSFPAPAALLPVLSAGLFIAAGTGGDQRMLAPLTNPVSTYVGNISYSLYLWHFPIIIFSAALTREMKLREYILVSAAILLVSVFAYHLFENPIRRTWLTGERRKKGQSRVFTNEYKNTALAALATATIAAFLLAFMPAPPPVTVAAPAQSQVWKEFSEASKSATPKPEELVKYGPEVTALQKEFEAALGATTWPDLTPTMDEAIASHKELDGVNACGQTTPGPTDCIWGDPEAKKTAVLLGDSVAIAWMPTLAQVLGTGDWKIAMRARYGCPFILRSAENDNADCRGHKDKVSDDVHDLKPDLVILANNYADEGNLLAWTDSITGMLDQSRLTENVVVLASPPHGANPEECYTPRSTPFDCVYSTGDWYPKLTEAEQEAIEGQGHKYVHTAPLFCTVEGECPAFAGTIPIRMDAVHIGYWHAQKIAPALAELLNL